MDTYDKQEIASDWSIDVGTLDGCEILYYRYSYVNYSGNAFVLYRRNNVLYEVNGTHCSCYSLSGQWEPEETTKEALEHRLKQGYFYGVNKEELKKVLSKIESTN